MNRLAKIILRRFYSAAEVTVVTFRDYGAKEIQGVIVLDGGGWEERKAIRVAAALLGQQWYEANVKEDPTTPYPDVRDIVDGYVQEVHEVSHWKQL